MERCPAGRALWAAQFWRAEGQLCGQILRHHGPVQSAEVPVWLRHVMDDDESVPSFMP